MPLDQRQELRSFLRLCFTCIVFCMWAQAQLYAQSPPVARYLGDVELPMESIDIRQGLSQGFTPSIVQDQDGYLWIATNEGLNRYDGYGFKVFRHVSDDSLSVASNIINFVFVDSRNQLWVSTNAGILDCFDTKTESFIHHHQQQGMGQGKPQVFVMPTSEMPDGSLIFPASAGAVWNLAKPYEVDDQGRAKIVDIVNVYPTLKYVLTDSNAYQFLRAFPDGSIWTYGRDSLFWFSATALSQNLPPKSFPTSHRLNWMLMRGRNAILLRDQKQGMYTIIGNALYKFDPLRADFETVVKMPPGHPLIGSAFIDSQDRLWTLTENGKYLRIDLATKTFVTLHSKILSDLKISSSDTYFATEDRQHNIWLGTNGEGILKISANAERFNNVPPHPSEFASIEDDIVIHRVVRPGKKAIYSPEWMSTWLALDHQSLLAKLDVGLKGIRSPLNVDADGNFWQVGSRARTRAQGTYSVIVKFDPRKKTATEVVSMPEEPGSWSPAPIIIDRDNQIWFGNYTGEGTHYLHFLDQTQGTVVKYAFPVPSRPTGYPTISDWYETEDGRFWFATTIGLFSFSKASHTWQHWKHEADDPQSLSDDMLFCVEPDPRAPDRYLWVGTYGSGLNCLDVKTGNVRRFNTADGLPNNVIYAIQFDRHNHLWLSTNLGICRFDPLQREMRNFSQVDGLPSNEFNRLQFSKADDGRLYFGGIGGTTILDPKDFDPKPTPAKTVINQLKLANKPIVFAHHPDPIDAGFHLDQPIEQTQALVFDHDQQMISFGFALLDLTTPSKNRFKYKMEGFNDEWIDAGNDHEATYTNLSPGDYTFQVRGCNSDNVWSLEPAQILITILPPWWGTWWFRILVILLVSGSIFALYNYRLQQLLQVERLRNRIGQDLHDEIGSTLSSISLYSAVMQRTSDQLPPNTINILDKIISSTSQMMESMNDMVWTIKASNDSFEQVINRMRAFAVNMTEAEEIKMTFDVDPQVEKLSLGMEQRKNVYLIYKEAVNNAAKYARCSELTIDLKKVQGFLQLTITDNGIGFDPEDKSAREHLLGGNGLAGMRARGKAIGAEMEIESAAGKGTVVRVKVPL